MGLISQSCATTALGIKSMPRRSASTGATISAIALVILILLAFLAMTNGFRKVIENAGSNDVAILLRDGASTAQSSTLDTDQLALLNNAPGVVHSAEGKPVLSPEIVVPASIGRGRGKGSANLMIRGIAPESGFLQKNIQLVEGRAPNPGSTELLIGRAAAQEFPDLQVGKGIQLAGTAWTVTGTFSADGSVYESEARADLHVVQLMFKRGASVQSVRIQLTNERALSGLQRYLARTPQAAMTAQSERNYFLHLASSTGTFIQKLGWPLALLMSIGALAGACNAMYTSIDSRSGEIVTLRTLGFGRLPIFVGVIAESLLIAAAGGFIGAIAGFALFDGMHASTAGKALGQVAFDFRISGTQILQAVTLALVIGITGSLFPGIKAAKLPLSTMGGN